MGGGSETVRSAQVIGLSKKFGALKKKILLENGKFISSGMGVVIAARGRSIADIKSMYNKEYLKAMIIPLSSILYAPLYLSLIRNSILELTANGSVITPLLLASSFI